MAENEEDFLSLILRFIGSCAGPRQDAQVPLRTLKELAPDKNQPTLAKGTSTPKTFTANGPVVRGLASNLAPSGRDAPARIALDVGSVKLSERVSDRLVEFGRIQHIQQLILLAA